MYSIKERVRAEFLFIHRFIHLFNSFLSAYFKPGSIPGTWDKTQSLWQVFTLGRCGGRKDRIIGVECECYGMGSFQAEGAWKSRKASQRR